MAAREALSHGAAAFNAHPPRGEVSLEQARARVIECARGVRPRLARLPWSQWKLPVAPVLAQSVLTDRPWPPFRRSMRDGYALRCSDAGSPLRRVGEVRAGDTDAPACPPGACVAIMTGAPVPDGLDAVVMVERTRRRDEWIEIEGSVERGDNIAAAGSDSPAGAVAASAGRRLTPATIAALAAAGVADPAVFAPPRVAVLATGDELVAATEQPGAAQIRNSNGPMLAAQCRRYGADVVREFLVPDDEGALERALEAALQAGAEAVVCSGGASVGAADLVAGLFARRGLALHFDAVRTRPGRPVLFAEKDGKLYFGLPGNPLGSLLACALLVRPALEVLAGTDAPAPAAFGARLRDDYHGPELALDAFRPVRLVARGLGAEAEQIHFHGSADLAAAAAADAFLHVPPGVASLGAGAWVEVVLA